VVIRSKHDHHRNHEPMLSSNHKSETENAALRKEFSKVMEQALQKLPLPYKIVYVLRAVEGFSVAETAELLHITPVHVKVRFNRAKALLQQQLKSYYSHTAIFEFHLDYCDKMVQAVFEKLGLKK
jgi:RNA polymerase sigma factor (sigma-70 family)